jgi:hypothetical protein
MNRPEHGQFYKIDSLYFRVDDLKMPEDKAAYAIKTYAVLGSQENTKTPFGSILFISYSDFRKASTISEIDFINHGLTLAKELIPQIYIKTKTEEVVQLTHEESSVRNFILNLSTIGKINTHQFSTI